MVGVERRRFKPPVSPRGKLRTARTPTGCHREINRVMREQSEGRDRPPNLPDRAASAARDAPKPNLCLKTSRFRGNKREATDPAGALLASTRTEIPQLTPAASACECARPEEVETSGSLRMRGRSGGREFCRPRPPASNRDVRNTHFHRTLV